MQSFFNLFSGASSSADADAPSAAPSAPALFDEEEAATVAEMRAAAARVNSFVHVLRLVLGDGIKKASAPADEATMRVFSTVTKANLKHDTVDLCPLQGGSEKELDPAACRCRRQSSAHIPAPQQEISRCLRLRRAYFSHMGFGFLEVQPLVGPFVFFGGVISYLLGSF